MLAVLPAHLLSAEGATSLDLNKLRKQLITHEGKRLKAYKDSENILTIGVGFNLTRADAKKRIEAFGLDFDKVKAGVQELTDKQAMMLLEADIDSAIRDCKSIFPKFHDLSDVRQRVLLDMMFNLGKTRFSNFKNLIANVNAGRFEAAADEMKASKWYVQVKSRGKTLEAMMRTDRDGN